MKGKSTITITGLVALVASLAAVFAIAAPAGQAARIDLRLYNGADGFAQTGYICRGSGVVELRADYLSTGAPGTNTGDYIYFQTRAERLTTRGWVDMGVVEREWMWAGIGGYHRITFPVGYGKVRFMTTFAVWNHYSGRYVYSVPTQELFLWSNGQVLGDSWTCNL